VTTMTTARIRLIALAAAAVAVVTGCSSDSISAPQAKVVKGQSATLAATYVGTHTFTYHPDRPLVQALGDHWIMFPANAVCDPARSTYGPTQWDAPCPRLESPITITAVVSLGRNGRPYIEFTPEMRFVPSGDPSRWVHLFVQDPSASILDQNRLLYCVGLKCWDESKTDPTMRSMLLFSSKIIWRRIKHFSGYHVTAGRDSTFDEEPPPGSE
jgi:hypothetical protein